MKLYIFAICAQYLSQYRKSCKASPIRGRYTEKQSPGHNIFKLQNTIFQLASFLKNVHFSIVKNHTLSNLQIFIRCDSVIFKIRCISIHFAFYLPISFINPMAVTLCFDLLSIHSHCFASKPDRWFRCGFNRIYHCMKMTGHSNCKFPGCLSITNDWPSYLFLIHIKGTCCLLLRYTIFDNLFITCRDILKRF